MPRRGTRAALLGAVAVAVALRLPFLTHQSLWLDELFTRAAVHGSLADLWHQLDATESTPPLSYLLTWLVVHVTGSSSAAALRAVPFAAGVATVPALYWALRDLLDERVAVAAAWLAAVSPVLVWYSLDARSYALLVLLAALSLRAYATVVRAPSRRAWGWWALAAAALVWTHWFAVFLVAAEALVLAWRRPDARRGLALALAGMAALVAPIVALFAEQAGGAARSDWIVTNSLGSRLEQVVRQFAMGPDVPRTALEAVGLALAAAGVAAGLLAAWRRPEWRGLVAVAALALAAPLVLAVAGADRFLMRNVLAVWPLVAALAALGLVRARAVPLVALVVVSVATVLWTQTDWRYENPDWAGLTRSGALPARAAAFAALPATDALVAEHYLGARPAAGSEPAPVFWIVAEPARNGTRDARPPAGAAPAYPGLVLRADRTWHGFRVLGYTAQSPTPPAIGTLSQPVFGQPPVLLVGG